MRYQLEKWRIREKRMLGQPGLHWNLLRLPVKKMLWEMFLESERGRLVGKRDWVGRNRQLDKMMKEVVHK